MKRAASYPYPTQPCAVRIADQRCGAPVPGVDPCRPCDACRLRGAPARLPWELAKPDDAALTGETVHRQGGL